MSPENSSILSANGDIVLVPFGDDPLASLTDLLLERHSDALPDLSRHSVIIPTPGAAARLRRLLLGACAHRGYEAVLPPQIATLDQWALGFNEPHELPLGNAARELVLLAALAGHPQLGARTGTWPMIDALLAVFDEFHAAQRPLPSDEEATHRLLARAYGIDELDLEPLSTEARWLHNTWQAWQRQLQELTALDLPQAIMAGLARALRNESSDAQIYVVGSVRFPRAQRDWLHTMLKRKRLCIAVQSSASGHANLATELVDELLRELGHSPGTATPGDAYNDFLDAVYAAHTPLPATQRAAQLRARYPESPARARLSLFAASGAEQQAAAIDIQVRRWWLQGHRHIGVVTNDRKLARRVRALLERANLYLRDSGGWPLSTTSAASALMRWIETVESEFHHTALLDLLKSPFVLTELPRATWREDLGTLEALLRARNISAGLARVRNAVDAAAATLSSDCLRHLRVAIDRIAAASEALAGLVSPQTHAPVAFLDALIASLDTLGMLTAFQHDEAGQEILAKLDAMRAAGRYGANRFSWLDFRHWLTRNLERNYFRPPLQGHDVEILSVQDSRLYHFDALIIAGAERDQLPGSTDVSPFLNDGVRTQLGLTTRRAARQELMYDFRRLLAAAQQVVISYRYEQDGERILPSPWVEALQKFHLLSYGDDLSDRELSACLDVPAYRLTRCTLARPAPTPMHPRRAVPPALLPRRLSASAFQRLVDCPYQFLIHDCLGIQEPLEIRDELEKIDFGQRVHRILEAFHRAVPGLPGPFGMPVNRENLSAAHKMLDAIAARVFAPDLQRSFLARGWLHRWRKLVPALLEWECRNATRQPPLAIEANYERVLAGPAPVTLYGRIDRIDAHPNGIRIVDYKTGAVPTADAIQRGESTQLPFYALLCETPVAEVRFLALENEAVRDRAALAADELTQLSARLAERIVDTYAELSAGKPLTAWGDTLTCERCAFEGVCRRAHWHGTS